MSAPSINTQEIKDKVIRKNFENILKYFREQGQLDDFEFRELVFTEAKANFKVTHAQRVIPKDILVTRLSGPGVIIFNYSEFTDTELDISVSAACRVRFLFGTKRSNTEVDGTADEAQAFTASPAVNPTPPADQAQAISDAIG